VLRSWTPVLCGCDGGVYIPSPLEQYYIGIYGDGGVFVDFKSSVSVSGVEPSCDTK